MKRAAPQDASGSCPARARLLACLLLSIAAASAPVARAASADAPPPPIRAPILEKVTSELILIETYVTDGLGHPVTDLTRDDFILEVGGLRRPIASAEFHSVGGTVGPASPLTAVSAGAPRAAGGATGEWPRRFVIFFDDNTSGAVGLAEARRAAERFLESGLAPTDEVAIAACEPPLRFLHDFTTDRAALRETLRKDLGGARRGTNFYTEMETQLDSINLGSTHSIQSYCELLEARWAGTLSAVQAVAASLSGWRGYKSIIFMGDGVPEYPMEPIYKWLQTLALRTHDITFFPTTCTLGDELKDLSRAAGAAGVTLNTVETRGLIAGRQGGGPMQFSAVNSIRMLAETTGGIASTQNDFVAAMQAIDRASRDFYILGYVPEEPADGRYRHIVVRCRRKGVTLRFRRGFTRLPPEEARIQAIESAHLFPDMHAAEGLTLDAVDGPADPGGRTIDLVLHVPASLLLFQPGPGGSTARMTIGFVGIDPKRSETFHTARRAAITLPAGTHAPLDGVNCFARARLPLAAQQFTAVAHDELSGWTGSARLELEADPAPHRPLLGLSLYAVGEESLWVEVPPDSKDTAPEVAATESTRGPASRTTFFPGESIVAAFRVAPRPTPPQEFRLDIQRDGAVVRSTSVTLDDGGALRTPIKVLLSAAGLAAGDYRLSVREIVGGDAVERGTKRFRIADRAEASPAS
jgi:VWFA-related protein